jgi:hypothetical protein
LHQFAVGANQLIRRVETIDPMDGIEAEVRTTSLGAAISASGAGSPCRLP